jgi:ribosome-associated toxin RatA of RatAB toxin-antitoxin module
MNQLQKSLQINAIFSGLTGVLLVALNKPVASLFDTSNSSVFWIVGTGLIFFSLTIIYEIKKQQPFRVLLIIIQDFLWVLGSIMLLTLQPFEISKMGSVTIAFVAMIVLFMGFNQAKALAKIDSLSTKRVKQLRYERTINSPKATVWSVISDVAKYHLVAPNIDDVKVISGKGEGMVRSCSHGKDSWTETCSLWAEEEEYAFEVNTAAPDYPYPFKYLKGNWKVEETDDAQTKVNMIFEFEYKRKFQNWFLHPILKGKFSKTAGELLDNWQREIEE